MSQIVKILAFERGVNVGDQSLPLFCWLHAGIQPYINFTIQVTSLFTTIGFALFALKSWNNCTEKDFVLYYQFREHITLYGNRFILMLFVKLAKNVVVHLDDSHTCVGRFVQLNHWQTFPYMGRVSALDDTIVKAVYKNSYISLWCM